MEDRRFDQAAKILGGGRSRRGALALLAGLSLGVLAESETVGAKKKKCKGGRSRCVVEGKKVCLDLRTDPANCGACGAACPSGAICRRGVCLEPRSCSESTATCDQETTKCTEGFEGRCAVALDGTVFCRGGAICTVSPCQRDQDCKETGFPICVTNCGCPSRTACAGPTTE